MQIEEYSFGTIRIDGRDYDRDVVIDRGKVSKRKKKASKKFREQYGHTPLSVKEDIPWDCRTLIIGTGAHGSLPVMEEVKAEANKRHVELQIVTTREAVNRFNAMPDDTNAVIHVTC